MGTRPGPPRLTSPSGTGWGARTDPEAPKHFPITLFLVPFDQPGITISPIWTMGDERTNDVFFDDVFVPDDYVVGVVNRGFQRISEALDLERFTMFTFSPIQQPGGRPPIPGATVADSAGAACMPPSPILAARRSTGQGALLDVSIADGMLALMALQADGYLAVGSVPGPGSGMLTGRYACYGVYGTSDGRWLSVAAIESRFWHNLCRAVGLEKWAAHQADDAAQPEIRADLEAVCG